HSERHVGGARAHLPHGSGGARSPEVGIPVSDDLFDDLDRSIFTGPEGLASRTIPIEPCATCGDPIAQTLPRIGEVSMPPQWRRSILVRVIGAEPVQV